MNQVKYVVKKDEKREEFVEGKIYLWPANAQIVISDIDGTITK